MLFSPFTFQLANKEYTLRLNEDKSLAENKQLFEDFVKISQTNFCEKYLTIDCQNMIIKSYLLINFGQVFFLENPCDREIRFDKIEENLNFDLHTTISSKIVGSKIMAHFAELSISVKLHHKKDIIIFRDKFSEGKTMAFSHQVDYLELSLYGYVPLLVKITLEALYERSILGVEIEFLNFGFDLVGTTHRHIKSVINYCLDDIFGKLPSKE